MRGLCCLIPGSTVLFEWTALYCQTFHSTHITVGITDAATLVDGAYAAIATAVATEDRVLM